MSCSTYVQTSENILVRITPGARTHTLSNHRQMFVFNADVPNASTYRIWVNGVVSANITFSTTNSTTEANLISALNTVTGLTWAAYSTAVGSGPRYFYLQCSTASRWFKISIDTQPSAGKITTSCENAGKQVYELKSALKSVSNQGNIEFTDVTPVMQQEEESLPTKEALTVVVDLYDTYAQGATDNWEYALFPGATVLLEVFENGNRTGLRYSSMYILVEDVQRSRAGGASIIEFRISARRQGSMVKPFGTIIT